MVLQDGDQRTLTLSRAYGQDNNFSVTKEIIRNTEFLLGSPNFSHPLNVSLSPLAGGVMEKGPKLGPGCHWGVRQTLVVQKAGTIRSWCHWYLVWPFMSAQSGSQTVSQGHKAEDGECAKPSMCPGYKSWRKKNCVGKCLKY